MSKEAISKQIRIFIQSTTCELRSKSNSEYIEKRVSEYLQAFADQEKAENKWVSVEEGVPDIKSRVLLCLHGRAIVFGHLVSHIQEEKKSLNGSVYINNVYDWSHGHQDAENPWSTLRVTHWQPLPEAPKQ